MKCPKCGYGSESKFCPNCGVRLVEEGVKVAEKQESVYKPLFYIGLTVFIIGALCGTIYWAVNRISPKTPQDGRPNLTTAFRSMAGRTIKLFSAHNREYVISFGPLERKRAEHFRAPIQYRSVPNTGEFVDVTADALLVDSLDFRFDYHYVFSPLLPLIILPVNEGLVREWHGWITLKATDPALIFGGERVEGSARVLNSTTILPIAGENDVCIRVDVECHWYDEERKREAEASISLWYSLGHGFVRVLVDDELYTLK